MSIESNIFGKAHVDFTRLKSYGFVKSSDIWVFERLFMEKNFKAVVKVDEQGTFKGDVYEIATDDIYLPLRVSSMEGFALEVRQEYERILQDICYNCCNINQFIFPQANRICKAIKMKYNDNPCFPFDNYSGCGVFKNPTNGKWYALIMNIGYSKIDKNKSGNIEVLNIKLNNEKIKDLLQQGGFYPAYHMNKKNWITIVLDNLLEDKLIINLIDESHDFTLGKIKAK